MSLPLITLQPGGSRPPTPTEKSNILAILGAATASQVAAIEGQVSGLEGEMDALSLVLAGKLQLAVATSAPLNTSVLWFNPETEALAVYHSGDWVSVSGSSTNAGSLAAAIVPTVSVGGISAGATQAPGTTVEAVLRGILAPYVAGSFSSFSVLGTVVGNPTPAAPGTREVGLTYTPTSASIGWVVDSEGNAPSSVTLTGQRFASSQPLTGSSPKAVTAQGGGVTSSAAGTTVWTVAGQDKNGVNIAPLSVTLTWQFMWAFGASATLVTDGATAQSVYNALQQKSLRSGRAHTVTTDAESAAAANKYTYIAFANVHGTSLTSIVQNGAQPVLDAFTNVGSFSVVTASGQTVAYRFYRSNTPGAFVTGTTLAVS